MTRVLVLLERLGAGARIDETDAHAQAELVERAIADLGGSSERLEIDLDLAAAARGIRARAPDCVFNLAESIAGTGRFAHFTTGLLESLGFPFTGCGDAAMSVTSNKPLCKRLLAAHGIATPGAHSLAELRAGAAVAPGEYILKSIFEEGSVGLDEDSVVEAATAGDLLSALEARLPALGGDGFVERYVDGREFNLSLLPECSGGVEVLPPAEIVFDGYGESKRRVVGWRAKWDAASFEYRHTSRTSDFGEADRPLLDEMERIARECWRVLDLAYGYARVDFRVDRNGVPFVLEINANPCIAADAGYVAAAERGRFTAKDVVARILAAASSRTPAVTPSSRAEAAAAGEPPAAVAIAVANLGRYRSEVRASDPAAVERLVAATGYFNAAEVRIARELVEARLERGAASGYSFLFEDAGDARDAAELAAYSCFGPIDGTASSFDLFWIAVAPALQGKGCGRRLLEASERAIAAAGGRRVYVETSSREQYASTRAFYERCGYRREATLEDFYGSGDGKVVYCRAVAPVSP